MTHPLLLSLLLAACGAPPSAAERLMTSLDTSGDGALDAAEFAALADPAERFARWDTSGDGRIDARELEARLWDTSPLYEAHQGVEERAPNRP